MKYEVFILRRAQKELASLPMEAYKQIGMSTINEDLI
jgi:mRNA-degrading endonuclease RelE of RelBE toxin-antitoxin system